MTGHGRNHARKRAPSPDPVRRPGKACRDGAGDGRPDGILRGDHPARYRCAACPEAPAPGARRRRGDLPAAVRRPRRPALFRQRNSARRAEARHRPRGGRALQGRRADHHQWRHHHLPDGAFPDRPPHADLHQFVSDRRAPAQALQEHGDAVGRHDLSRAEHHPVALRQRRDAQFLRAAHVHGRAGARAARADGGRSAAHPGRAEADRPGRRARRADRLLEIPPALEPHPVRPVAHRDRHHRRGDRGSRGKDAGDRRRRADRGAQVGCGGREESSLQAQALQR